MGHRNRFLSAELLLPNTVPRIVKGPVTDFSRTLGLGQLTVVELRQAFNAPNYSKSNGIWFKLMISASV